MESTEAIKLSKQEALSIFCFLELSYISVLGHKLDLVKNSRDYSLLPEIKYLLLVVRIWKNYKSEKIRIFIQDIVELYINQIYKDENRMLMMTDLKFMIPFIFSFRNARSKKMVKQTAHNEEYVKLFQRNFQFLTQYQNQLSLF
jgi:hypothetical protein